MAAITQLSQLDLNGTYSYADYLTWKFEERLELIKGKIMLMAAPNVQHQRYSKRLALDIGNFFRNKQCELFIAPFDVKLYDSQKSQLADKEVFTVVQPDLCVICDKTKLSKQGSEGAPDWVIEILSEGNNKKELRIKYDLYEENGVCEYWLVYPSEQAVQQFVLNEQRQKYELAAMFSGDEMISPVLFPELQIDLAEVFAE
jgi:Uma2 family endonuclease